MARRYARQPRARDGRGGETRFTTLDLRDLYNAGPDDVPHLDGDGRRAVAHLPSGRAMLRGVPFRLAGRSASRRFLRVTQPVQITPSGESSARHVVFAMFCQAPGRGVPATRRGDPEPDFMEHVGERVATVRVEQVGAPAQVQPIRVGIEVEQPYSTLEPVTFAAVSDHRLVAADWRGPHAAQREAQFGPPGSSSMAALPGSWAVSQSGVAATEDGAGARYWLTSMALAAGPAPVAAIMLAPEGDADAPELYLAGITLFTGVADPFVHRPRETLRLDGPGAERLAVSIDLGVVGWPRQPLAELDTTWSQEEFLGWGTAPGPRATGRALIDVAGTPDATLRVGDHSVSFGRLHADGRARAGSTTIRVLPAADIPLHVRVLAGDTGIPTPARVHLRSGDGRYLPPNGHRREVNPGLMEDYGSDLVLGGLPYAYVPGEFEVMVPPGELYMEVAKGFEYRPERVVASIDGGHPGLVVRLERSHDLRSRGWVTADTHVHFLPPTSALLQAEAEGLNLVNVLATQWGELFTNVADGFAGPVRDSARETEVRVGSENRMHLLGHVTLLGGAERIFPLGIGGGITSPLGDPVDALIADLTDRNRAAGGLSIAAHFPFPYGELAADIVMGKLDAIELFGLATAADGPRTRSWYRFLNAGYRVPVVGGTDKMSAGTAVGAVRTYARLLEGEEFSFEAWAAAVRAGRTFMTSGPLLELTVDGRGPGDVVRLPDGGGTVQIAASAASAGRIDALEVVVNGRVGAEARARPGDGSVDIDESIWVGESAWIAARCTSPDAIWTAFPTAVGAHTSPVYVECGERRLGRRDAISAIGRVVDAGRQWAESRAVVRAEADRARFVAFFEEAGRQVRQRLDEVGA